jgi:hypothetical protein
VSNGSVHLGLVFFARAFVRTVVFLGASLSVACAPMAPVPGPTQPADSDSLDALKAEVARLTTQVSDLSTTLADVRSEQQAVTTEIDVQTHAIGRVEGAISTLPDSLKKMCPPPRAETQCKEPEVQRVVVSGSKMVVGDVEQVWVDPPGLPLNARIDTTAANNALLADGVVEFERDGKSWVRFALHSSDSDEPVQIERRVSRHVRAVQPGGGEIKRPIIRMRIRLGDVQDTFWFVLTDRADHPVILGRTFLKDIALVEVGARYVQPRARPAAAADDKAAP